MLSFLRRSPAGGLSVRPSRCRLALEPLEDRTVPYALSGYTWANPNVSVSFMPDGTLISSSYPSNLFAVYNAAYPQATWQREVARALQSWANVSNLNFHFVPDDGSPQGTAGLAQGDSRFGDIRIGGYNMGSGILGLGWNPGSTTTAGDVELSTSAALPIGSMPDLTSVLMHEFGHGIGFNHSTVDPAVMEGGLWGTYPAPYADDIAGVQAMYGARRPDAYDAAASNDTLASATALSLSYGGASFNADVTTMSDVDYYRVVVPSGSDGTLTVSVDARNLSLFAPNVSVFDASGALVATASASTYGDVATVHLTGLVAGQTYYLRAAGATTDVFGMGAYKLTAQFGGFTAPTISPDQFEPNNTTATATKLGTVSSVSQTGLTLHASTDVDYYAFTAAAKGTFAVSITPTQDSGTLSLTVLNAQQAVLASGQSQTGGVTLSVNLASGQQYYLKVWSPTGGLSTYTLSMAKAGA
ncbi:MAG TPA: matrixin family metalloprotease, partial [Gemmataceae bacterium]|nr:matrixin family metalloprotease [Gemmataceae bacterium]